MLRLRALCLGLVGVAALHAASAHAFDWAGKVDADAADLSSDDPKKRLESVAQLGADDITLATPYLMNIVEHDPAADVRQAAARALGAGGAEAAVPAMIRWLNSPDKKEAAAGADVLGDIGGDAATAALTRSLGDADAGVRVAAVRALGKIGMRGDTGVVIALIPRLEDDKVEVKKETIEQLEMLGDRRAVIPLVARFGDTQQDIRNRAVRAVGRLGDPSAVPALTRLLDDSNEDIRSAAAGSLGMLAAVDAIDALTEQLNSGSDLFREKVAIALAQIAASPNAGKAGEDAMRILVANLASPQQRARTTNALRLAGRAAVPALVAHLSGRLAGDPTTAVMLLGDAADARATAALTAELERGRVATPLVLKALGATHDPAALVPLLDALSNQDAAIRLAAMEALEPLLGGDARAGDVLIEHLADDDLEVRILAAQYLGELADGAAAPKLIALTRTGNPERLRLASIDALGEIGAGPAAGKSIPGAAAALVEVLRDGPTSLHRAAATALSYLQDPSAIAPLIALARADRGPTRDEVVRALGATLRGREVADTATARRVLRDLSADANPKVADAAISGLAAANNHDDAAFLRTLTQDAAADRRRAAAWALGELHDTAGIPVLETAMASGDDRLAGAAAWALGEIAVAAPREHEVGTLVERWLHAARRAGWAAAIDSTAALARVLWATPRDGRAALVAGTRRGDLGALAFHRSRLVRINAASALASLGDDDVIKSLVQLARDASPHVRASAVIALARIGGHDDRIAATLKAAATDPEAVVRDAAKTAQAAPVARGEWATYYVVDPAADDAPVRQEAYFIHAGDGVVWATYSDARGDITSEHVPHGEATILPAAREPEY